MNSIIMPFSLAVTMLLFVLPLPAQQLQPVRVALSTPTPHMAPLWVAKGKEFFDKYGLDVQLILVNSGSLVAQMFAAGLKAEEIVDPSWLKKLDSEGFFDKVYGGKF